MTDQWLAVVCPTCGANLQPMDTGAICAYCGMYSQRTGSYGGDDEAARLERLRRNAHQPMHPPSSLDHLFVAGRIPEHSAHRAIEEAEARLAQVEVGTKAGEHAVHVLVTGIVNEPWCPRSVAQQLKERAARSLTHPVYRQAARASLCRAAIKAGDDAAAGRWLSMLDACPESIEADSDYRLTRSFYETRSGNFGAVLTLLGDAFDHVPIDGSWLYVSCVLRANAKEWLGDHAGARAEVEALRTHGPEGVVERIIESNEHLDLCPHSRT